MGGVGGELARLGQRMQGDLFPARVVDAQEPRLLPHPDLAPDILGRHRVIGLLKLDVAVAMHRAPSFLKHGKQTRPATARKAGRSTVSKNLPTCWRVVPWMRVSATFFSHSQEEKVLPGQTLKAASFDRVVLRILYARPPPCPCAAAWPVWSAE